MNSSVYIYPFLGCLLVGKFTDPCTIRPDATPRTRARLTQYDYLKPSDFNAYALISLNPHPTTGISGLPVRHEAQTAPFALRELRSRWK